jgi:co-chaperonin GroES (HSP10)
MNEELRKLVTKLYKEAGVEVEPLYPRVLVRVLPREQETKSGIWLPDRQQNKPALEGVVLKTYKPFWKLFEITKREELKKVGYEALEIKKEWIEAQVKPGDHVVFPSIEFNITPVMPLDAGVGDYRLIPEEHLIAVLEYKKETTRKWLFKILADHGSIRIEEIDEQVDAVLEKAEVIRKDLKSLTVSGK